MNSEIFIKREDDDDIQTQGKLWVEDITKPGDHVFDCVTLERAWVNNEHGISCYPPGKYTWRKVPATANIRYEHILIDNVPDRSGICIHIFNKYDQSKGCTGVGSDFSDINLDGEPDIINSGITFKKLMAILPDKGNLTVS